MRAPAVKFIGSVFLAFAVFVTFIGWYPFFFSLSWPSLALARVGVPHSWVASVVLLLGGVIWLGFWSRRQRWIRVIIASLILPSCYCWLSFLFIARASVPLPAVTPYDSTPIQRVAYLQAFDSGYRDGTVGLTRSYCFFPEAETRGFYDGAYQGSIVWYRMLGRAMPDQKQRHFESSAGIDGVRLELK